MFSDKLLTVSHGTISVKSWCNILCQQAACITIPIVVWVNYTIFQDISPLDHLKHLPVTFNSLRPRRNRRHFADDTFKRIFLNENVRISIKISLKFVPKGPINNIPALVQIMAWCRSGDKPLSETMMVRLPTHICVARPQWVKTWRHFSSPAVETTMQRCWIFNISFRFQHGIVDTQLYMLLMFSAMVLLKNL